nr:uncharacterized protein LOC109157239 [Ipomoea batatas]
MSSSLSSPSASRLPANKKGAVPVPFPTTVSRYDRAGGAPTGITGAEWVTSGVEFAPKALGVSGITSVRDGSLLLHVLASNICPDYTRKAIRLRLRVTTQPSQFLAFAEMKVFLPSIVQICWEAVKEMAFLDFLSSDEEDCLAVEEVSQCSGSENVTGLEDFEEGFGVDGADVTLKISLLKDFDRCGSSKKSKGIVVKEEK